MMLNIKKLLSYKELLDEYIKLAKNVDHPEENEDYPESVRHSKAMQALYDNVGGDEVLAIELHKAVMDSIKTDRNDIYLIYCYLF